LAGFAIDEYLQASTDPANVCVGKQQLPILLLLSWSSSSDWLAENCNCCNGNSAAWHLP
jgi:hypothetical protein